MSEWISRKLAGVISIKHGYAFKGEFFSEHVPGPMILTPGNFSIGGGFKHGKPKYYLGPVPDEFRLMAGQLVVTMTDLSKAGDTLGYPAIIPDGSEYLHNQRIGLVSIEDPGTIDKLFLYYLLRTGSYRNHILAGATGSTVRHTSPGRISDYVTEIPGIEEQRAIAALLGALDNKIAVNNRIAETARALARSHFRSEQEAGQVDDVELGSVIEFLNRGVAPRYTEDQSQLRVLNQKCVRDGRVDLGPSRRTLADKVPAQKLLKIHDVLVNSTGMGTLGRVAGWTNSGKSTVDSHVTIVRFDPAKIDPVCAGFAMLDAEPEIEALGEGSTGQTELSRAQLSALRIVVPSRQRSAALRPVLDALESRSTSALEESLSLAELRDALLPKLMSGEIRVREAEKVVEDVA
jgi:type I restriction enzyme S subunit